MEKLAYSVQECCDVIGLGRSKLYEIIRNNQLHVVRVGKRIIIPVSSLKKFLDTKEYSY